MDSQQIALSLRFFDDSSNQPACQAQDRDLFFLPPSVSELEQASVISDYLTFSQQNPLSKEAQPQIQSEPHQLQADSTQNFKQSQERAQQARIKNKSMFHNLQKHLITFLKRMVYLKRVDLMMSHPAGLRAYELWKIFKTCKECSKKSLYIIVGCSQLKKKDNMRKIALSLPQLQKMLKKVDFREIEEAQTLLRDNIHNFLANIPKKVIRERCKMAKFDEFYAYLDNFMEELKGHGVSRRMKKEQKEKLLQKNDEHPEDMCSAGK